MDFDGAISAHAAWKAKLSKYLQVADKSLKAADVGMDGLCALGLWLNGEGKKYSSYAEFSDLKTHHAAFHTEAAELIKRADHGEKVSEEVGLGANSRYAKASSQVVQSILKMKIKAT
jgi:hypothetical protein